MTITAVVGSATDPSRTTGVAPLSVFFSANGTRSTTETTEADARRHLAYMWDFGDSSAGSWQDVGQWNRDKNVAFGPDACHVYETPGTYQPKLYVTDGIDTVSVNIDPITVTDPDVVYAGTSTICFATDGNFTGAPAGSIHVTTSSWDTVCSYMNGSNLRLVVKGGQIFTSTQTSARQMSGSGGTICSLAGFGTGNAIVQLAGAGVTALDFQDYLGTRGLSDIRFMDLTVDPNGFTGRLGASNGNYPAARVLLLRCTSAGTWGASEYIINAGGAQDSTDREIVVVECSGTSTDGYAVYTFEAYSQAYLGNVFSYTGANADLGEGLFRVEGHSTMIVQHNSFTGNQSGRPQIKLNSASIQPSTRLTFSDNKCEFGYGVWPFDLEPQNASSPLEIINNYLVERNWMIGMGGTASGTNIAVQVGGNHGSVRLNLIDLSSLDTGFSSTTGIQLSTAQNNAGGEPAPSYIEVLHNTIYSSSAAAGHTISAVLLASGSNNNLVRNNLAFAPSIPALTGVTDNGTSNTVDHNAAEQATDPFAHSGGDGTGTLSSPSDFALLSSDAVARDQGASAPGALLDYANALKTGVYDLGILERGASAWNPAAASGIPSGTHSGAMRSRL